MTNEIMAARRSLAAAMATEPRIQEALANPAIPFDRTRAQIQRALVEAKIGFVPKSSPRGYQEADARSLAKE